MINETLPTGIAQALCDLFKTIELSLRTLSVPLTYWFKRTQTTAPVAVLFGLVLLAIGVIAGYCDYIQMVMTIELLFPIEDLAWLMALAIVVLTGACGILLHQEQLVARWAAVILFVVLVAFQGYVAYERTVRIALAREVDHSQGVSGPVADSAPLMIDGAPVGQEPALGPMPGPHGIAIVRGPAISPDGLLGAGLAIVLAAASAIAIWQGLDKAGWLIACVLAAPAWVVVFVPLGIAKLLNSCNWRAPFEMLFQASLDGIRAVVVGAFALIQRFAMFFSAEARYARALRNAEARMKSDRQRMLRRLQKALALTITQNLKAIIESKQDEIAKVVAQQFADALGRVSARAFENAESEETGDLPKIVNGRMTDFIRDLASRITVNGALPRITLLFILSVMAGSNVALASPIGASGAPHRCVYILRDITDSYGKQLVAAGPRIAEILSACGPNDEATLLDAGLAFEPLSAVRIQGPLAAMPDYLFQPTKNLDEYKKRQEELNRLWAQVDASVAAMVKFVRQPVKTVRRETDLFGALEYISHRVTSGSGCEETYLFLFTDLLHEFKGKATDMPPREAMPFDRVRVEAFFVPWKNASAWKGKEDAWRLWFVTAGRATRFAMFDEAASRNRSPLSKNRTPRKTPSPLRN